MKLIFDNIIFALQQTGGISVYWNELLKRMLHAELDMQFLEHARSSKNIQRGTLQLPPQSIIREKALPQYLIRYLPVTRNIEPGTLFHSSYYRYVGRKDVINIVTVYDFIYELFRSGLPRLIHGVQKRRALQNADIIICISESTKTDLLHFFPEIDAAKLRVIPLAASGEFHRLARIPCLSEEFSWLSGLEYVMYVGDRSSYKNFFLAVDVVTKFPELFFLIIGGKPLSKPEHALLTERFGVRYRQLTALSVEQLNELYNHAYCLLYPSQYEGFGIPVLEAMQSGCPVVALRSSSIPEICGDAGLLSDTSDVEAIGELVASLKTYCVREDFVLRGLARANMYSWDETFHKTLDCYREAVGNFADRRR